MKKKYIHPSLVLFIGLLSLHTFSSCVNTKRSLGLSVEIGQKVGLILSSTLHLLYGLQPIPYYLGEEGYQSNQLSSYNKANRNYGSNLEKLSHLKKVSKLEFNQPFNLNPIRARSDTKIDPPCLQSNQGCARIWQY